MIINYYLLDNIKMHGQTLILDFIRLDKENFI